MQWLLAIALVLALAWLAFDATRVIVDHSRLGSVYGELSRSAHDRDRVSSEGTSSDADQESVPEACRATSFRGKDCYLVSEAAAHAEAGGLRARFNLEPSDRRSGASVEGEFEGSYPALREWLRSTVTSASRPLVESAQFKRTGSSASTMRSMVQLYFGIGSAGSNGIRPLGALAEGVDVFSLPRPNLPAIAEAPKEPRPAAAPEPPPFNYRYLGRVSGSSTQVFLERDGSLVLIGKGQELLDGYQVVDLEEERIVIVHRPTGRKVTVSLPSLRE